MRPCLLAVLLLLPAQPILAQQVDVARIYERAAPAVAMVLVLDAQGDTIAFGSGFFIDAEGALATNYHVIEGATAIQVSAGGEPARLVEGVYAADDQLDLAIVKVSGGAPGTLSLSATDPSIGEPVVAIGNPEGFEGTVSEGIVSGIRRWPGGGRRYQITAPISAGSSGGPVLNSFGEVIGIATATWKEGQNLNFAVPSTDLHRLWSNRGELQSVASVVAFSVASELAGLSAHGRTLEVGSEVVGEITEADPVWVDGSYVQPWELDLPSGQTVTLDLRSDEFDAYLMVTGPGIEVLYDDDGAGACDARITLSAPETGTFLVVANTLDVGETGVYRLRATDYPMAVTEAECVSAAEDIPDADLASWLRSLPFEGRTLSVGEAMRGQLTFSDSVSWEGTFTQAWALQMRAGQEATVDLLSDDFDAYLYVLGPGLDEPLIDDDGAGACDARITFTAAETGAHRVIVSTILGDATGQFRLRATSQPGPTTAGECDMLGDLEELMEDYEAEVAELAAWLLTQPAVGELRVGEEVTGELTASDLTSPADDTFVQVWELPLRAGDRATVDLLSTDFDAFLYLVGPGVEGADFDDDSAGACDARLTITASESGTFRVAVNTVVAGSTGSYRLRVTREPGPTTRGECGVM